MPSPAAYVPPFHTLLDLARNRPPDELLSALPERMPISLLFDEQGTSLVAHCVFGGLRDALAALVAHDPAISLHDAAVANLEDRVRALIAGGTDALNLLSPDGWTALHLAAHFGHTAICRRLLDAGALTTVFSRAFERNLPIHAACAGRSEAVVALLAPRTPNLDEPVAQGFTALMEAAYQGLAGCVEILLEAGADPRLERDDGKTATEIAREAGHTEVAERIARAL